ncbi:sorting nexin-29-like isoform X2 [Liolophura sinensis]|uniref:sorting nexin-29-like isoform X2 n=1 Tax=Liolophura sinensis TaxID=3198878 RepID=UPI003158CD70
MNGDDVYLSERHALLTRLLDAVKQCQVRFGGRSELATDGDSRVSCLCAAWEAALQHGMRHNNKALSALKQVTEMTGLSKVTGVFGDIKNLETEPTFWSYVKEHLTKHEVQRYTTLKSMVTDAGRGRAWLRASLNEHSLERYMHMLLENTSLLSQYYEEWAFLRDQERSSMLPMMAAGLGSILFAITIDKSELNAIRQAPINVAVPSGGMSRAVEEPRPVISGEAGQEKKKEKKKKKKIANIVSFGEDDDGAYSSSPSSVKSPTLSVADYSGAHHKFSFSNSNLVWSEELTEKDCDSAILTMTTNPSEECLRGNNSSHAEELDKLSSGQENSPRSSDITMSGAEGTKRDNSVIEKNTSRLKLSLGKGEGNGEIMRSRSPNRSPHRSPRSSDHEPSITSLSSVERPSSHGSFSSADVEETDPQDVLTPLSPTGKAMDVQLSLTKEETVSYSVDSNDLPSYIGEDVEFAAMALALAQKGFSSGMRTDGDGGNAVDMSSIAQESMSTQELKQAVVAMMVRKDEVEEQNRSIRAMLEQEMETSSTLRAEIEELKLVNVTRQEKDLSKLQALQKENELLKHQLRKYVNAVQLLRKTGEDQSEAENLGIHLESPQPAIPPPKPLIDYSHEASEYEKKLIQVAEMHGELMEFNELLHRQLGAKENLVKQLRTQLVELRGPLPQDENSSVDGEFDSSLQSRTLINIWIPSAFLRGSSTSAHHVYQVYVRIRDEEWNVYRRYNQFRDFFNSLKKKHPIMSKFDFPPKKAIGSKDARVVEMRRKMLQMFLRNVINYMMQHDTDLTVNVSKDKLTGKLAFFGDDPSSEGKNKKGKKQKSGGGRHQSGPASQPQNAPVSAPPQYTGL